MSNGKFIFERPLTILDFSKAIGVDPAEIIKYFFIQGTFTNINTVLRGDECKTLCSEFGWEFSDEVVHTVTQDRLAGYLDFSSSTDVVEKVPVVTIMGHVDHGKTTLLDRIRGTRVAAGEFGGITQHIGAYQIIRNGKPITFLDTPGHQAFTRMRARGANITDIVILVVAADDGVKPQTVESIQHALASKARIITFVNKIDKGARNIGALKNELMGHNLVLEEFGGDVIYLEGSALTGQGVDDLLDTIALVSEVSELRTTLFSPAVGYVIESKMERGLGPVATILLARGQLSTGDFLSLPSGTCRIKGMSNELGQQLKMVGPATPVRISGFRELPSAGDRLISARTEAEARDAQGLFDGQGHRDLLPAGDAAESGGLSLVLRADVSGSLEAIRGMVFAHNISIISSGIGPLTESDLQLASIAKSLAISFNQRVGKDIFARAKDLGVTVQFFRSVYEIEEYLDSLVTREEVTEKVETVTGRAEVVKLWYHSKVGTIAGCKMASGKISKIDRVRVLRGDEVLVASSIKSFKTEAFEIKECSEGQECGIVVHDWNDIKVGDIIEGFRFV